MTQRKSSEAAHGSSWWLKALTASLTGLIASLLIGIAWSAGVHYDIKAIRWLETAGADLGTWYQASRWHGDPKLGVRYVFVDVDQEACAGFLDEHRCRVSTPISAPLIADFIKTAQASKAALIILDVAPFENENDRKIIQDAACETPGNAWIIAPLYGRVAGQNDWELYGDESFDLRCARPASQHRLRLASFQASPDAKAHDDLVRRFSALHRAQFSKGSGIHKEKYSRSVPSAPYLASLLSDADRATLADCVYYRPSDRDCTGPAAASANKAALVMPGSHQQELNSLINYSLPSLATLNPDDEGEVSTQDFVNLLAWCGRQPGTNDCGYQRLRASRWLGGLHEFPNRPDLDGAILVLGSSEPAGMDLHLTPAGPMAGAEIIINAIRTFRSRDMNVPPLAPAPLSFKERALEKVKASLMGGVVMTVAWLLIFGVLAYGARRGRGLRFASKFLAPPLLFILGLGCVFHLEFLHETAKFKQEFLFAARPVDLVSPLLLLGLEGYAEAMNLFMTKTEHALHRIFDAAHSGVRRLISPKG